MNINRSTFPIFIIALFFIGSFFLLASDKIESEENPTIISMYMYADWCGACQAIKPKMAEAVREFEGESVLFTRMDMTDDFTAHQSKLLASSLGLIELFEENEGKTGFILLVDADTHEILDKITREDETEDIIQKISATLN
ncbi:MAG: thioredoxin domain-containing protein [Balneolaceae bacterium]